MKYDKSDPFHNEGAYVQLEYMLDVLNKVLEEHLSHLLIDSGYVSKTYSPFSVSGTATELSKELISKLKEVNQDINILDNVEYLTDKVQLPVTIGNVTINTRQEFQIFVDTTNMMYDIAMSKLK